MFRVTTGRLSDRGHPANQDISREMGFKSTGFAQGGFDNRGEGGVIGRLGADVVYPQVAADRR